MSPAEKPRERLCIITPAHSSRVAGGSEYQIDCLLGALIPQQRYDIYYLTTLVGTDPTVTSYQIVRIGKQPRAPKFGYLTHAAPLYRALLELKPSVIYQRVACGYSGVAAHYARRHGVRFVWHVAHDSDVVPDDSLEGRNPIRRFLEKRSVEYAIRHASCIITQTEHQARLLLQHYGRTAAAIVPNFQPLPQGRIEKKGPLTVVWIASLKPWKQPEAFVNLAKRLSDLRSVRVVMVGPEAVGAGDRQWLESLHQQIRSTPNLQYLGGRPQSEVNELLAQAHVFVNTSRYEGFPNTFIQAWAREAAVVSLNVDPDGLLEREERGICCHASEDRLHQAVRSLLTDSSLRARYTARGRQHAIAKHSLANANVLAELLDANRFAA